METGIPHFVVNSTRFARIHATTNCDSSMNMDLLPRETVGQRIRIAREYLSAERQQRISQADLAELCGWGQTRIGNYERDIRNPNTEAIQVIAMVTGCRAEWIQFGTGSMHAYQEGLTAGIEHERQQALEVTRNPFSVSLGPPLAPTERAILDLLKGLTPEQQEDARHKLEETQRKNREIYEALSRQNKDESIKKE